MGGEAKEREGSGLLEMRRSTKRTEESEREQQEDDDEEEEGEGKGQQIPLQRWVMHGALMFGREFCYAIETALVAPLFLLIGLPEQYYSLPWLLSPILGLLFTPLIGSASDQCTLRWGRRRPFILGLFVGVLLGVALFLNGSLIGLAVGDKPGNQLIGIILTMVGVVVLDFCADASEGPIRAYLLDVADTEEQDMALNIHAFSAGLGGAVGYIVGGLDWNGTALGQALKSPEQVLFLFAGIVVIISVILHMLSIPEVPLAPVHSLRATANEESRRPWESGSQVSLKPGVHTPPVLDAIAEEDRASQVPDNADPVIMEIDFLSVDRMRSKSDSVLAMPDATIVLDSDLDPDAHRFLPDVHRFLPTQCGLDDAFKPSDHRAPKSPGAAHNPAEVIVPDPTGPAVIPDMDPMNCPVAGDWHQRPQIKVTNDHGNEVKGHAPAKPGHRHGSASAPSRPYRHTFYRQPSFTFSYYGRVGSQRHRLRRTTPPGPQPITTSRSLNDLSDLQPRADKREFHLSAGSLSSASTASDEGPERGTTVRLLWLSMFKMPRQLWRLCVCHLLTWFSYIAEAVFYTDFMAKVIFNGDPAAPANSAELQKYHNGVQMGCWGLVVYAATSALSSAILQKYLDNFDLSIRAVYMVGTLGFSFGTAVMAVFPNVYVAMIMISSMGVISMSISYCPYALLGQYHEIKEYIHHSPDNTRRGFGIDCAILSCQVYISQILVAAVLGSVVDAVGSVRVIPMVASGSSFLGFLTACFLVIYPDLESGDSKQQQEQEQRGLMVLTQDSGETRRRERTLDQKPAQPDPSVA